MSDNGQGLARALQSFERAAEAIPRFGIYTQQEAAEMIGTSPQRILQARIIRQCAPMEAVEVANGKPLAAAIPNCQ